MNKKILYLPIKKKWFDLIAQGKKKEEYREQKRYWLRRLYNKTLFRKEFDEVHFKNGYHKDSPFMRVEFKGIYQTKKDNKDMFVIKLGKVLEVSYESAKQNIYK